MAVRQQPATLTCLQDKRSEFTARIARTEVDYLDLGLEYHALPLQLRRLQGVPQDDCTSAFVVRENTATPDCIGYLDDVRKLYRATTHHLEHSDLDAADNALTNGIGILEALGEQLVAIRICVDSLHRQFSDMLDTEVEFAEGNEYRLAMRPEQGVEKYELLRNWVMALPEVREWFRIGTVRSEEQALWLAAGADGQVRLTLGDAEVSRSSGDDGVKRRERCVDNEPNQRDT